MTFLYPYFLFAMFAVAIPIVIYLFSFRLHKVIYFSNIQFLKNIKQETKSKTQLKHLLILISRILAIVALVLAFARPYLPVAESVATNNNKNVAIYIDNSFSMDAESKYGKLIEVAKTKAHSLAGAYTLDCKFLFTNNNFEDKHQRLINREQLHDFLNNTAVSPNVRKLSEVVKRQKNYLDEKIDDPNANRSIFIFSDFQKSSNDIDEFAKWMQSMNDSAVTVHLVPLATQPSNNLFIDSCWFESPSRKMNQAEILFVKVVNKSENMYSDIPVKLTINNEQKALASFNINAGEEKIVELTYTISKAGEQNGKIEITDYPIVYDNSFYFSYSIAGNIEILSISKDGKSNYLKAMFENDDYFRITYFAENSIRTAEFANFDVIFISEINSLPTGLQQELVNYISNGGIAVIFPSIDADVVSYNDFLSKIKADPIIGFDTVRTKISTINYQHEIYDNVFKKVEENSNLPVVYSHYLFSKNIDSKEILLMSTEKGDKFISSLTYNEGKAYIASVSLSDGGSNFAKHPIFVPTIYNIALYSQHSAHIYYVIGKDDIVEIKNNVSDDNVYHIQTYDKTYDFIPYHSADIIGASIKLFMQNNIQQAGNYQITNGNEIVKSISFNFNRAESDLSYYTEAELGALIGNYGLKNTSIISNEDSILFSTSVKELSQGKQYWKLFIILALIFIAVEVALLRFWK